MSPGVDERLTALFAPADQEEARTLLIEQCGENIPGWRGAGIERLQCAVLKLSDGKVDKLRESIDLAKRDFRNVLVWSGFGYSEHLKWWPEKKW